MAIPSSKVLVAGGSGFIGRHLVDRLLERGSNVVVMSRTPSLRDDKAVEVGADVNDSASLAKALKGIEVAYYLVHSLDRADFETADREGARNFALAAKAAGVSRVVYLGGLGNDSDELSPHLRSRREVEQILSDHVETVALRASIVVGQGSASWEILCQLVERLPVMITPRWVTTATQPIAIDDVVEYLVRSSDRETVPADHYDIGAPESTTYQDMMTTVAKLLRKPLIIVPVPVLSPGLSARWLRLVTDVDMTTARALVRSLVNPVEVTERRLEALTGHHPMTFLQAATGALSDRLEQTAASVSG